MPEVVNSSKLWTKALKKNYGSRQVVCGVDISITSGAVIGLLGAERCRQNNDLLYGGRAGAAGWRPGFSG